MMAPPFHREQGWLLVITFLNGALCKKCIKIIVIRDCAREKKKAEYLSVSEQKSNRDHCFASQHGLIALLDRRKFCSSIYVSDIARNPEDWSLSQREYTPVIAANINNIWVFSSRFQHRTDDRCWGCPIQIRSLFKLLWGRLLLCVQIPFSRTSSVYHRPESATISALIHRWIGIFRRECTC